MLGRDDAGTVFVKQVVAGGAHGVMAGMAGDVAAIGGLVVTRPIQNSRAALMMAVSRQVGLVGLR